ncbi:MAG: citryl-CoA lyase [Candidatus Magasanikbacteria bacterium]|nr:citryl-CoA lyase [Candidatus Magasanikbacteria bacterium]
MQWKTSLTKIENEKTFIHGQPLEDLVKEKTFVEVVWFLFKASWPTPAESKLLNTMFGSVIDHGVGTASAMTARTTASTGVSVQTAVAAGILALGNKHGGAIEGAANLFKGIPDGADIAAFVKDTKTSKKRLPGFGHRVLAHDTRVNILFVVAKEAGHYGKYCIFAEKIAEELAKQSSKPIPLNIDGAMAAVLLEIGIEPEIANGFFLIGRVPGLIAQIAEELKQNNGLRRLEESEIVYE